VACLRARLLHRTVQILVKISNLEMQLFRAVNDIEQIAVKAMQ
jgi:hypothetical protein